MQIFEVLTEAQPCVSMCVRRGERGKRESKSRERPDRLDFFCKRSDNLRLFLTSLARLLLFTSASAFADPSCAFLFAHRLPYRDSAVLSRVSPRLAPSSIRTCSPFQWTCCPRFTCPLGPAYSQRRLPPAISPPAPLALLTPSSSCSLVHSSSKPQPSFKVVQPTSHPSPPPPHPLGLPLQPPAPSVGRGRVAAAAGDQQARPGHGQGGRPHPPHL